MKNGVLIGGIMATMLCASAGANAQESASKAFLSKAIEGNLAEVQMGNLAQTNGQSDAVKSYGQMLVADHSAANAKATQAAQSLGVTAPSEPNSKQKADFAAMSKMSGAAFDHMFARDMVADHQKDLKEYQQEAKAKDAAGAYAQDSLPTLEKHLKAAQALQK